MLSGADGVQLGEEGIKVRDVRRIAGNLLLLGRSVHSVDSAKIAGWEGADFLVVGTIFPTGSHPGMAHAPLCLPPCTTARSRVPTDLRRYPNRGGYPDPPLQWRTTSAFYSVGGSSCPRSSLSGLPWNVWLSCQTPRSTLLHFSKLSIREPAKHQRCPLGH